VFGVPAPATGGLYVKNMNGGKEELILPGSESLAPSDWSRDGRWLVYTENNSKTGADIWLLADPLKPSGDRKPVPLVRGPSMESQGQISPDGKWLAYSSNESGISEVYLRALSGSAFASAAVWQVSSSGGAEARWRSDGRELFFLQNVAGTTRNRIFSVPVGTAPNPAGTPRPLFEFQAIGTIQQINVFLYSPSPDGQRFLVNGFVSDAPPSLDIVLNWGSTAGQK
jgi:dipeptidyl aminopeptidase/acylaminoacyl peptidase